MTANFQSSGPFHVHGLTVAPFKFMNGWVISSNTLLDLWLLIHAGIKVKPC